MIKALILLVAITVMSACSATNKRQQLQQKYENQRQNTQAHSYTHSVDHTNRLIDIAKGWDKELGAVQNCIEDYVFEPIVVLAYKNVIFGQAQQHPVEGVWQQRYSVKRCNESKVYNVLFQAQLGDEPKAIKYIPGDTLADPLLVRDTFVSATGVALAKIKEKNEIACKNIKLFDTAVISIQDPKNLGKTSWSEKWIYIGCNQLVDVNIEFSPDKERKGTKFKVSS